MAEYRLGEIEARFSDLIWDNEPLSSGELVKLANLELDWKKSTTYTVLKRLCERELFKNENGKVSSIVSKEEFITHQSEAFIDETFSGSLPKFLAAFSQGKRLSENEINEIQNLIDSYKNNTID